MVTSNITETSKTIAAFFRANCGDARDQFGNCSFVDANTVEPYIQKGACLMVFCGIVPVLIALAYPVSRETYDANLIVHKPDENSSIGFIKAVACLPEIRPMGFHVLSSALINRWPNLKHVYGYRGGRKTRLTRLSKG